MTLNIQKLHRYSTNIAILLLSIFLSSCSYFSSPKSTVRAVTILGGLTAEQKTELIAVLRPFEERTGIEIQYEGATNSTTLLSSRVKAGNPPDIFVFPQPALIADYAASGDLVPLTDFLDERSLQQAYSDDWLALGSANGNVYALWYRAIVKGLVWYRPSVFEAKGYRVPTDWDDLLALSDQIVADEEFPWCLGLEGGEATGWVGTDWIEAIMLRTADPEVYRQWANGELPFTAPQVVRAFNEFGTILRNSSYIEGGAFSAITTPVEVSPLGLFDQPPSCYMHQQGSFISLFFPEGELVQADYDVFLLPEIEPAFGTPVLVSGDAFAMFNDTAEARQLMAYIATAEPHQTWAKQSGFISPHKAVSPTLYPNPVKQKIARILFEADDIYFDAADMMPNSVGLRPFWTGIVDFAAGKSAEDVTQTIDVERP